MPLNLDAPLHDLPKHPENVLPKFYPWKGVSAKDHLQNFYLVLNLLNFDHDDVACIIFHLCICILSNYPPMCVHGLYNCSLVCIFKSVFLGLYRSISTILIKGV